MTAGAGNGDEEDAPGPAMHRANCKRVEHGAPIRSACFATIAFLAVRALADHLEGKELRSHSGLDDDSTFQTRRPTWTRPNALLASRNAMPPVMPHWL